MESNEITIAEVLKQRGYATACVGKWHLGDQPSFLPTHQGFDEYFGIPFSNDQGNTKPFLTPLPLVQGEAVIKELEPADQDYLTKRYTEYSLDFIERNAKPFFLYLPHSMVHSPHHASPPFRGKTGKGIYADVIAELDWSVGQILDKLEELRIADRTLVLFTSDNGGPYFPRSTHSSNFPYSGGKVSAAEGGFRVPTIAWWPGSIPPGSTCDHMASTMDLLPSFAVLTGKPFVPASDRPIDGLDLSSLLRGKLPDSSPRTTLLYYTDNTEPGAPHQPGRLSAMREGRWKFYRTAQRFRLAGSNETTKVPAGALFDLEVDIAETNNVAAEHPAVVKRFQYLTEQFVRELGDGNHPGILVRQAGYAHNARPMNFKGKP